MHVKNAGAHTLSPLVSEETAGKLRAKNTVTLACAAQIVRVSFVFRALRSEKLQRPEETAPPTRTVPRKSFYTGKYWRLIGFIVENPVKF